MQIGPLIVVILFDSLALAKYVQTWFSECKEHIVPANVVISWARVLNRGGRSDKIKKA